MTMRRPIRILGIDPGLRRTGWGVVAIDGNRLSFLACGSLTTDDKAELAERLLAIHDGLREVFPGRFKVVKPAAVELHTTMDLLCDAPTTVVLTPDTTSEQTFLPEPTSLRASLLLADRGYVDLHYLRRVPLNLSLFVAAQNRAK